jgi:PTH1 family peptidyl-tRNA hydrolase
MADAGLQALVIAGLGNPGREYEMTRHNIGFIIVQALAIEFNWSFKDEGQFNAKVAKGKVEGCAVHLVLPMTYMNLSGTAIRRYLDYYGIAHQQLVVVTDDVALPFGQLRLRLQGSAGGHNGLKSVEAHLGANDYPRLRVGVGHPGEQVLAEYVLETFNQSELKELPNVISRGSNILKRLLKESLAEVMSFANRSLSQAHGQTKLEAEMNDLTKPPITG